MTGGSARRLRTVAAAALLALVAVPAVPAGDAEAADGRCAPGKGVTVVVDYGPLGGGVVIGCDPDGAGKPAAQVVQGAGFSLTYVSSQPGFVCRVEGRPTADEGEDCGDTPPADAYWGLFWSDADPASWVYSSEGVGSLDVPEGGSIGWRFQDGGARENPSAAPTPAKQTPSPQPSSSPSPQPSKPPKADDPTPTPAPSASVPPGAGGTSPSADAQPGSPSEQTPSGRNGAGAKGGGDQAGKGTGTGDGKGDQGKKDRGKRDRGEAESGPTAEPSESPTVAALEPASDEPLPDDQSSTALTLIAGAAVLLLGGSAGVIAWRRRG